MIVRTSRAETVLRNRLARLSGVDPSQITASTPLRQLGIDEIKAVDLAVDLQFDLGVPVNDTGLELHTFGSLLAFLNRILPPAPAYTTHAVEGGDPRFARQIGDLVSQVWGSVYRGYVQEEVFGRLAGNSRALLAVAHQDRVLGMAIVHQEVFDCSFWSISWLGVLAPYRHVGVGSAIVHRSINHARTFTLGLPARIIVSSPGTAIFYRAGFVEVWNDGTRFVMIR